MKDIKKKFKEKASKNPDIYYATDFLKKKGYVRSKCEECGTYYWAKNNSKTCGDPACSGGFRFFKDNPAKKNLGYIDVWKEFSKHMGKNGYEPIERYPVVARWRDDTDFVQASIYDFQPYVVNGEVDPPANPLVVPQFCLRFNDVDNVGVTMNHFTGFVMIGQHAFMPREEWDQEKYFSDLYNFFTEVLGIPEEEIILHEDAWAGGGNYGPCMEFFCKGMELANQVYMLYEVDGSNGKELSLKVLDMGMGHERVAWFTKGKGTAYDASFPSVMEKLYKKSGVKYDEEFLEKYMPYGSYLNLDEVEDISKTWSFVASKVNMSVGELKEKLLPLSSLYSVAEHSRTLLFALADGALPSNVKGGYNLRVILRRALQFLDKYKWDFKLEDVCRWHAEYLKSIFPELLENISHVENILKVEQEKYYESKKRAKKIVAKAVDRGKTNVEDLLEMYDSNGITPEQVVEEAEAKGITVNIPENFYSLVSERHEEKESITQTVREEKLADLPDSTELYYQHYDLVDFKARVKKIIYKDGKNYVVLDETAFYPTSGGQIHDIGFIEKDKVIDVFRQGKSIVHVLESISFKEGDTVKCKVDFDRRVQVSQHHTATHILTGTARKLLGEHVWQAGAAKTVEKGRLDITHYEQLTDSQLKNIEDFANKVVKENLPVEKLFMSRDKAEALHGVRIYQGGAVPGKELRIVKIDDFDVEACGGTHVDITGDVGSIKMEKTTKLQDGVVRLEFLAGSKAEDALENERMTLKELEVLLDCNKSQIPLRAKELFQCWKKAKKGKLNELKLESIDEYEGDILGKTAEFLKTQPKHVLKTIKRFKKEIEDKIYG